MRPKTYSYLTFDGSVIKNSKWYKKFCIWARNWSWRYLRSQNKINYLGKYNIKEDSLKEKHEEFIKGNRIISQ